MQSLDQNIIQELLDSKDESIFYLNEKNAVAYLNPDRIFPTQSGILLQTDSGKTYLIEILLSNSTGSFVSYSNPEIELIALYPRITCKGCQRTFHPTIFNKGVCPHCNTQN